MRIRRIGSAGPGAIATIVAKLQNHSGNLDGMRNISDAIIVGGGPAGASCAIWLARLGLAPLLGEAAPRLGGLENDNPFRDEWIAVLPGVTGQQVAANIAQSVAAARVPALTGIARAQVARAGKGFDVTLETASGAPSRVHGRFLVIASGARARLPGADDGQHWPGVLVGPGVAVHEQDYRGLSVAVLGAGTTASKTMPTVRGRGAREVHLYSRTVRARPQLVAAAATPDLHVGDYVVDPARAASTAAAMT